MSETATAPDAGATVENLITISEKNMLGDLVKAMLTEIKLNTKATPFGLQSESEQAAVLFRLRESASEVVRKAVELIASAGRPSIKANLASVTIKDGIKAVCEIGMHAEEKGELFDAVGQTVLLVLPRTGNFLGDGTMPRAEPNQKDLLVDKPVNTVT